MTASPDGVWATVPSNGMVLDVHGGSPEPFRVGGSPMAIAANANAAWVIGSGLGHLARFGIGTPAAVKAPFTTVPSLVAVDQKGAVFASERDGTVLAVNHSVSTRLTPTPTSLAAGEGWLWAVTGQDLLRIGPNTLTPITHFEPGAQPIAVALDHGVWTVAADGFVRRFDPRKGKLRVNLITQLPAAADAISAVESAKYVWILSKRARNVYGIDANGAMVRIHFSSTTPVAIAASPTGVWIATSDRYLTQITGG
jgi:DNA-binding beta-propeller fold protein YncE